MGVDTYRHHLIPRCLQVSVVVYDTNFVLRFSFFVYSSRSRINAEFNYQLASRSTTCPGPVS